MLKLEKINYEIDKKNILKDINLEFKKGKFYGLIGPNGSGKSTLLDIIIGHKSEWDGKLVIDNIDSKKYSMKNYAKKISLVPQEFDTHFNYTALEILEMGRYPYSDIFGIDIEGNKIIKKFIKMFSIEHLLNKSIMEMSGGERQRILFIKALIQDTDFILLDEATSNLDLYNTHKLMLEIKKEINEKNKSVIAVIHDMNLASLYCDEIVMLKKGKIIFNGETQNALTKDNIKNLFKVETEIIDIKNKKIIFPYLNYKE